MWWNSPRSRNLLFGVPFAIASTCCCLGCGERTGPHTMDCQHKLKQIGVALHAYHDRHGVFPPAVVTEEAGRVMHSWRVLILPFVGEDALYRQYDLSQPWNSSHNQALLTGTPNL